MRKITKYHDLKKAIKDEWDMEKVELIPVIIVSTGLMKKSLKTYLEQQVLERCCWKPSEALSQF